MALVSEGLAELRRIATQRQCGKMLIVLLPEMVTTLNGLLPAMLEDCQKWNVREKLCYMTMSLCLTGASVLLKRILRSALRMSVMLAIGHR